MNPVNILDAGSPLPGATSSSPLWIDKCDASSNLTNTLAPAALRIPLTGASGNATLSLETLVSNLDWIDHVEVVGTLKGKLGDTVSLTLNHETLGQVPLITNKSIRGPLTNAYPIPPEERTFLFGETIPSGYLFSSFVGNAVVQTVVLPENVNPNDYYYNSNYYAFYQGFNWQTIAYQPEGSTTYISVPAHRYPYTPDYNYDNAPGAALVNGGAPLALIFRGFRYLMASQGQAEPSIVQTVTFPNQVYDSNATNSTLAGYQQTPWGQFLSSGYGGGAANTAFTETLYANYGAQDWVVTNVNRVFTTYHFNTEFGINAGVGILVTDYYTVRFLKWQDILWSVTPLSNITWQAIFPPSALWQFYPPDYQDYLAYAERSEALDLTSLEWRDMAADGNWSIGYTGQQAEVPVNASPTVPQANLGIPDLALIIYFRTNDPYQVAAVTPGTDQYGNTTAYVQGNLRPDGDDRAFIGILCGMRGSTTMGILCGYAIQRIGRTGEIYNVAYSVLTCCNLNNVNSPRVLKQIAFAGKNWGDLPFSTKGDAGEAGFMGPLNWRIYPVRGQIGLTVLVNGNSLIARLMGQYPDLPIIDATVPLITSFQRVSLNA